MIQELYICLKRYLGRCQGLSLPLTGKLLLEPGLFHHWFVTAKKMSRSRLASIILCTFAGLFFSKAACRRETALSLNGGFLRLFFFLSLFLLDDDSEPILGQWFEETISPSKEKVAPPPPPPPPPLESSPRVKSPNKQTTGENGNILASRKDPELVQNSLQDYCILSERECDSQPREEACQFGT